MFDASNYLISVAEMPEFEESAAEILTQEEIEGLIAYVAKQPDDGRVIANTGGIRWLKWPACGRSGARVIYYFHDLNMPVYLLSVLRPGEWCRLKKAEKARMRAMVDDLVRQQWSSQVSPLLSAALRPIG